MPIEVNDLDDSFNTRIRDSLNTTNTTDNTANLAATLNDVGNVDGSTNDSYNAGVDVTDSFNEDSHDAELDTDVDIDDSFNDKSDNSTDDHSDNSMWDSHDDNSDNSTNDSFNDNSDNSTDDHSINAGNREYNVGMAGGAAASEGDGSGGGGVTIIDQSVNSNITAWGHVSQDSASRAVAASGDGSTAAGDDVTIHQSLDESTSMTAGGDLNVGNTTDITTVVDSFNTETDNSTYESNAVDVDIDDSWNDNSHNFMADNSFNSELDNVSQSDWDIDANVIWGSDVAVVVDDLAVDDMPDV